MTNPRTEALAVTVEALRSELLELDAVAAPTDEQVTRSTVALEEYDTAVADLEKARAHDAKMDTIRNAVADTSKRENGFGAPSVVIKRSPWENLTSLRHDPTSADVVARAVTAISEDKTRGVSDDAREAAVRAIETVSGAALHTLMASQPAYVRGFERYMAAQGDVVQYDRDEAEAIQMVRTALNITTGASGQFLLPTLFDPSIVKTGTAVRDGIRQLARVETITQNVWNGVTAGNVTAYWAAESAAFTDGNPTMTHPAVTAAKLTAYLPGSYEVFEDATQLNQLPGLIAEGMDYVEQTAFISGSGSNAPKGIVTAISATAGSTVTITTRGSFTTASSADVYALVNAVPTRFEQSSTWVANKGTFNLINQMSPSGGGSLFWQDFNTNKAWTAPALLGYQTQAASDMSSTYASGTVFAILGDFSRYLIVDRLGVTIEFMPQVFNSTPLPIGQRALVAHKRVGGDCLDINAFRFLKA